MNAKSNTDLDKAPSRMRRTLTALALGLAGAVTGYTVSSFTADNIDRWEDGLAIIVGAATLVLAAISAVIVMVRPRAIPKGCGTLQVIVLALSGLMMLAPVFGPDYARAEIVYGGVIAVLVLQTLANVQLWRLADEMLRNIMVETCALSFWALQLALFLYASAERMGMIASISAWGMLGILMVVYLLASCVIAARRGLSSDGLN
jgi:hypothetical protein